MQLLFNGTGSTKDPAHPRRCRMLSGTRQHEKYHSSQLPNHRSTPGFQKHPQRWGTGSGGKRGGTEEGLQLPSLPSSIWGTPLRSSGHALYQARARETPARTVIMSQRLSPGIVLLLKAQPLQRTRPSPPAGQQPALRAQVGCQGRRAETQRCGSRVYKASRIREQSDGRPRPCIGISKQRRLRRQQSRRGARADPKGAAGPAAVPRPNASSRLAAGSPRGTAFPRLTAPH